MHFPFSLSKLHNLVIVSHVERVGIIRAKCLLHDESELHSRSLRQRSCSSSNQQYSAVMVGLAS